MADRNENSEDRTLRALARAAMAEAESAVDVESDLEVVRARAASDVPPGDDEVPRQRPVWTVWAAAAAVVALVGAGVVVVARDRDPDTVRTAEPPVTAEVPAATLAVPEPPATTTPEPPATTTPGARATTTVADTAPRPDASPGAPIPVDFASPPPLVEPTPFATLALEANPDRQPIDVAVSENGAVVKQPGVSYLSLVDTTGAERRVGLDQQLSSIVAGPGDVVYGLRPNLEDFSVFEIVAVATAGKRSGEAVVQAELPPIAYTELPVGSFGHGADGIIDRARSVNSTVIGYADADGAPTTWSAPQAPLLLTVDRVAGPLVVRAVDGPAWELPITPSADVGGTYLGPSAPAPTSGGRAIYHTSIGPDTTPQDEFAINSMPVIAILESDGSGAWVRLPDAWSVASSDVWGTVLLRTTGGTVELAMLDDALGEQAAPTDDQPAAPPAAGELAIGVRCAEEFVCTELENTNDGGVVAYDPADQTLTVLDAAGTAIESVVTLQEPVGGGWFVTVGPDDVAYFAVDPPVDPGDPILDLVAIPLTGPRAGEVVLRLPGEVDGSGDTDLVPTAAGLVEVGCCGFDPVKPDPGRAAIGWVDRNGDPTTSDAPAFSITRGDTGNDLIRSGPGGSRTFPLPTVASNSRGMPELTATDDGGALMRVQHAPTDNVYLVRFGVDWPENRIDNTDVLLVPAAYPDGVVLLRPDGEVVTREDDRFVVRPLEAVGSPGWDGRAETQLEGWSAAAPGLNEHIDANAPAWAAGPDALAVQLVPQIFPNELFFSAYDRSTGVLTMTTEGFLDDSVYGTRLSFELSLGSDGLYRVGAGSWSNRCQPSRGHQDYRQELCV